MLIRRIQTGTTTLRKPVGFPPKEGGNYEGSGILFDDVASRYDKPKLVLFNGKVSAYIFEPLIVTQNDLQTKLLPRLCAAYGVGIKDARIAAEDAKKILRQLHFYKPTLPLTGDTLLSDIAADVFKSRANIMDAETKDFVGLSQYAYRKLTGTLDMPGYDPDDPETRDLKEEPACCH